MTVYFKEVGQGDSIILEWEIGGHFKIGIIDCNKKDSSNPIIEHLRTRKNYVIEFIILSHPHNDHFSGLLELLNFCRSEKIKISYFLHTCASKKEYLQYSVRSISDTRLLINIFRLAASMHENQEITNNGFVNDLTSEFDLGNNVKLKIVAPSNIEYTKFNQLAFKNDSSFNNNPDSNFLSTVIKLYADNWYILFTSDAKHDVFWRLNRSGLKLNNGLKLNKETLICGQIPHHGSGNNYYSTFWRLINDGAKPTAAISVGKNSYGHPSEFVLSDLKTNGYDVRLTNFDNSPLTLTIKECSNALDMISEKIELPPLTQTSGDIIFTVKDSN